MVTEEHITAFGWASTQDLDEIVQIALRVNDFLTGLFLGINIRLVDFKLEFGRLYAERRGAHRDRRRDQPGQLPAVGSRAPTRRWTRTAFRQDLGRVEEGYQEVARRASGILAG